MTSDESLRAASDAGREAMRGVQNSPRALTGALAPTDIGSPLAPSPTFDQIPALERFSALDSTFLDRALSMLPWLAAALLILMVPPPAQVTTQGSTRSIQRPSQPADPKVVGSAEVATADEVAELSKQVSQLQLIYGATGRIPVWPVDRGILQKFGTAQIIPILTITNLAPIAAQRVQEWLHV